MTTAAHLRELIPNVGAEEAEDAPRGPADPTTAAVARLWQLLFAPGTRLQGETEAPRWPRALGAAPDGPAFAWLDAPGDRTAWINTEAALREASDAGRVLSGPAPEVVRRVHDKAFAHAAALQADLVPASLRDCIRVFEPDELRDADRAVQSIGKAVAAWPAWTGGAFTLKPRLGGSGRGRAGGRGDAAPVRGALSRLARRGGALLEPWLERSLDLSAQLWVDPGGGIVLLATTEQVLEPSGLYRGQRGFVDYRGRVVSGSDHDEPLRESGVDLARAAADAGFFGPCGVDAFVFRGPSGPELRRGIEFNARFTLGTICVGIVRRASRLIAARLGLEPGQRRPFHFGLDAPAGGWPEVDDDPDLLLLRLAGPQDALQPALLVARDRDTLDRALEDDARSTR